MNSRNFKQPFKLYRITFSRIIGLTLVIGALTRIILLFNEQTEVSFSLVDWVRIFILGAVNDAALAVIAACFLWLMFVVFSDHKYKKPWGYGIWALFGLALGYVTCFNTVFDEYGSVVPQIVSGLLLYKFISFGLRLWIPSVRVKWRAVQFYATFFLYVLFIFLNAFSEVVFWSEFGVRYNFIAVDYLIYTNEVIGNIFESYPIIPLAGLLVLISVLATWLLVRKQEISFASIPSFRIKAGGSVVYVLLFIFSCFLLGFNMRFQQTGNVYVNELQANGIHRFYLAFWNNELAYKEFYVTLPDAQAEQILQETVHSGERNLQIISDSLPEQHKNIVLITIESMSASYLKHYGNGDKLTPTLDQLTNESLVFNQLFATGNRTVRGLEAVTLCLPPSPGESIVKRPNNGNLFSTGKLLKDKGYIVQFLYGGDSYFDNMEAFFSGNSYEIIDAKTFSKDEITFKNIWGVCDEDMYNKAIQVFNQDAATGKPFFGHIMTVSNHRPFTYPEGKIDIPANAKSRKGGVKYTDYAIGKFLEMAKQEPWFENTLFVITADHCASSAGKTEIPLDKYHIPAMIYAPGYIQPQQENTLVSQIDILPTVFGLLHFSYDSYFYGQDIFSENYRSRALSATYQNLGYWEGDVFTVLSPVRRVEQYRVKASEDWNYELLPLQQVDSILLRRSIAHYQTESIHGN
ncbi:MAG: LTA synthase family protein [Candidatus Symbiothrix sp.]|nr:LTA synthase family protein [Candidatus Symbiothrix sp.]